MRRGLQRPQTPRPRAQSVEVEPDAALRESLAFLLAASGDRVRQAAHERLAEAGLMWPHHLILAVLFRIGGLSQQTLASRTGLDRSTVSSLAAELEHEGAVVRERDLEDGRTLRLSLTDSGRALADEAGRAVAAAEREALRPLARRERERVRVLLGRAFPQPRDLLWWLRQG